MALKAVNTCVFIIQDAVKKELGGILIPSTGKVKPQEGTIFSIGGKVTDPDIKKGKDKKAVYHAGVGQEIEVDGQVYRVLEENHIIAVK